MARTSDINIRFHADSDKYAKQKAKKLKKALFDQGDDISLSRAYRLIAKLHGFSDFAELQQNLAVVERSPFDESADERLVKARRSHHLKVITELGFPVEIANILLDDVGPTTRLQSARSPGMGSKLDDSDDMWANFDDIDY